MALTAALAPVVWVTDREGQVVEELPGWETFPGQSRGQYAGVGWQDAIHFADRGRFVSGWKEALRLSGVVETEFRLRCRDGSFAPVSVRVVPVRDRGSGEVVEWVGACQDISRQRGMEETIREQARVFEEVEQTRKLAEQIATRVARLQRVTAALSEAVTIAEVAGVVVEQGITAMGATAGSVSLVSDDGEHLEMVGSMGYSKDVIDPWQRYGIDAPIPLTDAVRQAEPVLLGTPEERIMRYPALAQVRAMATTRSSACIPLMFQGRAIGVMGLSFATEMRFLPEDREFMLSLARQCAQAIERARLYERERRAHAELEAANKAKDQFLAVLSHELRTPLTPVLATVGAMELRNDLKEDVREELEVIRRNVEMEARLIDDLLDLTRIARNKLQLNVQSTCVHQAATTAWAICRAAAEEKSLRVSVDLRAERRYVRADPARLQQILWNVLKNAIKFTPEGGAVSVRSREDGEGSVLVEVTDSGIGIEPEVLPRLFDAFEQGGETITKQFGGLGLGLAISKALAEAHGGRLWATSAGRGCGATFTLRLPAMAREEALPPEGPAPKPATWAPGRSLRILLVEDHMDTAKVMSKLLRMFRFEVEVANTVEGALSRARQSEGKYDLVISDLGLPDGSGLEVMRELKQRYGLKGIALSGFGMEEDCRKSAEAGFHEHLTKPVNVDSLRAAIDRVAGAGV